MTFADATADDVDAILAPQNDSAAALDHALVVVPAWPADAGRLDSYDARRAAELRVP